jgi:hypothetical protein
MVKSWIHNEPFPISRQAMHEDMHKADTPCLRLWHSCHGATSCPFMIGTVTLAGAAADLTVSWALAVERGQHANAKNSCEGFNVRVYSSTRTRTP